MTHLEAKNPVAERAEKRREVWEAERVLEIRRKVAAGEMTEAQAKERGL
jgi:hypothetical protein